MPVHRLSLVSRTSVRNPPDESDQEYINCFPEMYDEERIFVVKRPGLAAHSTVAADTVGRGIFSWNGHLWSVFGDTLYKDGVANVTTLATSTGRVYFDIWGSSTQRMVIHDGSNLYTVQENDTVTNETDPQIPSDMVPGLVVLDGYTFVMDDVGQIHNSELNDTTDWQTGSFITAEVLADGGTGMARHINYIVAFGNTSTELFYDAANASGTPLARLEGAASLIGCPAGDTIVNVEQDLFWVAEGQGGGRFVAKMEGLTPTTISTYPVEEALSKAGTNISSAFGFHVRINGHSFYVLTIPHSSVAQTWAFDITTQVWSRWTSYDGSTETYFKGFSATKHGGKIYVQHETNGKLYTLEPNAYTDDSNAIKVVGTTNKFDGQTNQNKFLSRLEVISDLSTSEGTLYLSWSDDDYKTFHTEREVDLQTRPFITRLGRFQRRAFKYRFEDNLPMRLESFELRLRRGHYGA